MMNASPVASRRLARALSGLAATFRGMTAGADEYNCECHWGSPEELAQLKVPDEELDADLLRRTWQASDWEDHASVLRRILPQLAAALVSGLVEPSDMADVGRSFARGDWRHWPAEQTACVHAFFRAWWVRTLTEQDGLVPAHRVLTLTAEASATLTPWLRIWETSTLPAADRHLAEAVTHWEYDLLGDQLPWTTWQDEADADAMRIELTGWLIRHAAVRLRRSGASEELLHRIRLLNLAAPTRWEDPHWPNHRY